METQILIHIKEYVQRNVFASIILFFVLGFVCSFTLMLLKKSKEDDSSLFGDVSTGDIYVDLSGAIQHPGIYKVAVGSRIGDAIKLGGGILNESSTIWVSKNLNLSEKLKDSQKIYIPFEWEFYEVVSSEIAPLVYKDVSSSVATVTTKDTNSKGSTSTDSTTTKSTKSSEKTTSDDEKDSTDEADTTSTSVNVNKASLAELDELSGIGPGYAQRIIDNRSYKDYDDFVTKSKVPKSVLEKIKGSLTF
jgi:competence protein ComEA